MASTPSVFSALAQQEAWEADDVSMGEGRENGTSVARQRLGIRPSFPRALPMHGLCRTNVLQVSGDDLGDREKYSVERCEREQLPTLIPAGLLCAHFVRLRSLAYQDRFASQVRPATIVRTILWKTFLAFRKCGKLCLKLAMWRKVAGW